MKNQITIAILSLFSLMSCSDDYYSQEDARKYVMYESGAEEYGYATANVNGQEWRASSMYATNEYTPDSVYYIGLFTSQAFMIGDTVYHIPREDLGIFPIKKYETGRYELVAYKDDLNWEMMDENQQLASSGMIVMQDDGDVVGPRFELDAAYSNWVSIDEWDEVTGLMQGRFEIALRLIDRPYGFDNPSRILFENGYFECVEGEE